MDFYAIVYGYKNSDLFVNNNGFLGFFLSESRFTGFFDLLDFSEK